MNTIDIVTPTMWKVDTFISALEKYCEYSSVNKIYLIDNNHLERPKSYILNHPKIKIISFGRNIYVNPAWNEGYYQSKADVICLLNDDIIVDEDLFDQVSKLDISEIDIIGSKLKGSIDNYHIVDHPDGEDGLIRMNVDKSQPIGGQAYAFGICMFIKRSSYKVIPTLYQIWFGDDYLIQKCKHIYAFKTNKIKGEISKTIVELDKCKDSVTEQFESSLSKRIQLDTHNAYHYGHFKNGKNWDILKKNTFVN
jgi:hypothetical protein